MWRNHPFSQPEKQDIKNTNEHEGWKRQERRVGENFKKVA